MLHRQSATLAPKSSEKSWTFKGVQPTERVPRRRFYIALQGKFAGE
jgi:hypothetical protein